MSRLNEGRVVVITGAGDGIGREHALLFAETGAKVVVNDLGGEMDGSGTPTVGPALAVVEEIKAMGGEAVANGDDVSDWDGAGRLINTAIENFGTIDVLVNNAGILRDRMLVNMSIDEWDSVIQCAPARHVLPHASRRGHLAGAKQRGQGSRRPHHQHHVVAPASTATSVRRTTARPRWASPASRSSRRRNWRATA